MHGPIVEFILNNPNSVCVPIGIFIRYIGNIVSFLHRKKNEPKSEDIMTKTYAHMVELHERSEDAAEERTQIEVRNALLKKENKDLKIINSGMISQIDDLKKHITDLEDRLKK